MEKGFIVTLLTWCFFVFGTPIADAGIVLDFPIRIITNFPMQYTEMIVMSVAATSIFLCYINARAEFKKTILTRLLYKMITNPFSLYGMIIVLSIVGTFLSAYFENSIYSLVVYKQYNHKSTFYFILLAFFALVWILYLMLIYHLGINKIV